jgi:hypothetical protein
MQNPEIENLLTETMSRLAKINTDFFRNEGTLPASLVVAPLKPRDGKITIDVMPLELIQLPATREAIRNAALTVTCLEGYLAEQPHSAPLPDPTTIKDNPDARHCFVYLAQARDGTRACAVQYILRPEHGRAVLAPLKVLNGHSVALMDSDIADATRPGRALQ